MIVMPRRLSDEIATRVRALIEEQQLEAGMRLPAERQLAAQLGVSRNSLREALAGCWYASTFSFISQKASRS